MDKKQTMRSAYSVKIPPNATPEEIKAFMKEFMKNWGKDADEKKDDSETT